MAQSSTHLCSRQTNIELMTQVASLYYLEDVPQAAIGERLGLSRIKVGRLLKKAREEAIVDIKIHTHPSLSAELESTLQQRFGLRHVILAADQPNENAQRKAVAQAAATYISRQVRNGATVAVGMGRNVGAVADCMGANPIRNSTFVSAIGGSSEVDPILNSSDICRRLANCFGGQNRCLYAPSYAESTSVRKAFLADPGVRHTLDLARQADLALVGVGDAHVESAAIQRGYFSPEDMVAMRKHGAVGDILGHFFDINGQALKPGMSERVISLGQKDLKQIPYVIGIASEAEKTPALLGTIRSGLLDVVATSLGNARRLLDLAG